LHNPNEVGNAEYFVLNFPLELKMNFVDISAVCFASELESFSCATTTCR